MNGENLIGNIINERYELLEVIGGGGMAVVYKANDRLLNRLVAVKILKDSLKNDAEIIEKFSAEGKAAAALSHNNIVSVYDVGNIDGISFIVMEYVDGETLTDYISKNKPIQWQTACEMVIQIASALDCAHEHGIIHRDIKPLNILLTKDNVPKVADFGIASAVSTDTVVAGGSAMGSVHYISPEQARGGYVDNTSDLYSLGVVLYEMLTGSLPFDGDNAVTIALMKLEQEPISPKVINLDIPQNLDAIVMKAIAKEQHLRYKTANEFITDLKALLNEDSMHIISATKEENISVSSHGKDNKKHGFNPIIASAVLVIIIAVIVFFTMTGGKKEYIVPNLLNMTLEEALNAVADTEFTIDEEGIVYEVSEDFEEGKIILQNPGANQSVKKNKKIQLTISSGVTEGNISVPSVVNMPYSDAKALLESKGLKCEMIEEASADVPLAHVISQSPKSSTKVTEGYTVILHVCTSIPEQTKIKVPELRGLTRTQAEKALADVGLVIGNTAKEKSDLPAGQVVSQKPEQGEEVEKNTTVDIVISENEEPTQSPVQTPQTTPTQSPQQVESTPTPTPEMMKKTLTIKFPESSGETVHVRVLANGKEIHNQTHNKSEEKVDILVQASKDAEVQVYMDDKLVVQKIIEFN